MAAHSPARDTRPIRTRQEAELFAMLYLRRLGYTDAVRSAGDEPDGVHVHGTGVIATVHAEARAADVDVVRRIHRAQLQRRGMPVVFSFSGYVPAAMTWADRHDVALVACRADRSSRPANVAAGALTHNRP